MGTFLRVSFGTIVALVTAAALLMLVVAAALDDAEMAYAGLLLWGLLAGFVATGWLLWVAGRWAWRRGRRA